MKPLLVFNFNIQLIYLWQSSQIQIGLFRRIFEGLDLSVLVQDLFLVVVDFQGAGLSGQSELNEMRLSIIH